MAGRGYANSGRLQISNSGRSDREEIIRSCLAHYREAEADIGEFQSLALTTHLENTLAGAPVEILTGSKIVEIRQYGIDKGRAYSHVASTTGPYDFVLAIGDDRTDEDLFAAIGEDGYPVHVGPGGSIAASSLHSPGSVRRFLALLVKARS